jgi:hypothetical protein
MTCPHCSEKFGLFSDEVKEIGKTKVCPRCGNGVTVGIVYSRFLMVFLPIMVLAVLTGFSGVIAGGVAGGLASVFGMGLKRQ